MKSYLFKIIFLGALIYVFFFKRFTISVGESKTTVAKNRTVAYSVSTK